MRHSLRAIVRAKRANAATEFALILPIMLLFVGGIVEFGHAFEIYSAVNNLATRYAITYADCYDIPAATCQTVGQNMVATAVVSNMAPQLPVTGASNPTVRVFEVTMSATAPATPAITYAAPSGATLMASEIAQAQASLAPNQVGVIVTVSYTYTLTFGALMSKYFPASLLAATYTVAQQKT